MGVDYLLNLMYKYITLGCVSLVTKELNKCMQDQTTYKGIKTICQRLGEHRYSFTVSFLFVFILSFSFLHTIGFVPELTSNINIVESGGVVGDVNASAPVPIVTLTESANTAYGSKVEADMVPTRIVIESVGIDITIENPESRDIAVLDEALLAGAVHYPGSGLLDDNSNMFLFGHSSFLPVINNENFRAFNGLEKVKRGDIIRVESSDTVNIYSVMRVELIDAQEALVELSTREKKLTLSTCNSFGAPGDRYIVEASFVGSYSL